jgi:hypothetical protein
MGEYEAKTRGEVHDHTPNAVPTGFAYDRKTVRGESVVQPTDEELYALEGTWGTISNPTPGTGITSQASVTAFDATKDVLHIFNGETAKHLIVKYIKLFVGTVPGGSGLQKYEFRQDTQPGYTSGGTALTAKRANLDIASPFGNIVAMAGALVTVAGSAFVEKTYSGQMRNGVGLAGDEFLFTFGAPMLAINGYLDPATTVGQQKTRQHGPLIIKPGGALRMSHYGASLSTAAVLEWEIGVKLRARQAV